METKGRQPLGPLDPISYAYNYAQYKKFVTRPNKGDPGEILRNARGLIAEKWIQGEYFTGSNEPGVCSLGAISRTAYRGDINAVTMWVATEMLEQALAKLGYTNIRVNEWNDAPERTKEDVLAAYDKAIELWDALTDDQQAGMVKAEEERVEKNLKEGKEVIERNGATMLLHILSQAMDRHTD